MEIRSKSWIEVTVREFNTIGKIEIPIEVDIRQATIPAPQHLRCIEVSEAETELSGLQAGGGSDHLVTGQHARTTDFGEKIHEQGIRPHLATPEHQGFKVPLADLGRSGGEGGPIKPTLIQTDGPSSAMGNQMQAGDRLMLASLGQDERVLAQRILARLQDPQRQQGTVLQGLQIGASAIDQKQRRLQQRTGQAGRGW